MSRLHIDVLGPLRVCTGDGADVTPDGVLQRRLLALLVLRRGSVVTADAVIDALWPSNPPRDPLAALHNHLFRLRRNLPDGVVRQVGDGYRLDPAAVDLDADRFTEALADGDAAFLDDILARWHGPAYPELDDVDEGRTEAARLGELRRRALEARAERRLADGDTAGLVAELTSMVDEEPLREHPRRLLMDAMAQAGRTAEALRAYDDFRRLLGDELGIEPSPSLTARHAELLGGTAPTVWVPASRLPVAATSIVGREALAEQVVAMVQEARLVTLVGPGGVGKTRLLLEVGRRLRARNADRPVVMCELAAATEATAVDALASSLTIDGRPGVRIADRIVTVLAEADVDLLLDNCEHVLDPIAAVVEQLLASCPQVRIVATSRERLRSPAEQLCAVPTLPASPAAELFIERARAVAPDLDPPPDELAVVDEIVRRLDGLPLAIELAAARLHTHDVDELAVELDRRFVLLAEGPRASTRHGSLGAAVSWSLDLLDAQLQRAFIDLSIFAGSFTAADAAAVCALDVDAAAAALRQLAERSLVARSPGRRFVLLETMRAFGRERLGAEDRADEVSARHARHQVQWVEEASRRLFHESRDAVLLEIDAALPELRAALDWLLAHGDVDRAGRLVAALRYYGFLRLRPDVMAWAERVTAADLEDRCSAAPLVWVVSAYAAWMGGDVVEAGVRSARALRASEGGGRRVSSEVASINGNQALYEGRLDDAVAWYRQAVDAADGDPAQQLFVGSTELLARAYAGDLTAAEAGTVLVDRLGELVTPHAAYAWYCAGEADLPVDVERARGRFERALMVAEATGASFITGLAGASKASIDARIGNPLAAAEDYRRLITHWQRAGMWGTQWTILRAIAGLLARLGRPRDAAVLEGAVRATRAGHRIFVEDEAVLAQLGQRLRRELGDDVYTAALAEGRALDGDAAVAHALRAL